MNMELLAQYCTMVAKKKPHVQARLMHVARRALYQHQLCEQFQKFRQAQSAMNAIFHRCQSSQNMAVKIKLIFRISNFRFIQ